MTEIGQLHDDLHFVRSAVVRRERSARGPAGIYYVWAAYVLIGYTLIDFQPRAANLFFMIGGLVGGLLSWEIGKRFSRQVGERDRVRARQIALHFWGGILLSVLFVFGLAMVVPALRGPVAGQIVVGMIGLVYFLAGVYFDRNLLWLGPVLLIGGVVVGLVPRFGWTALGVVIALGLVIPTLIPSSRHQPTAATA